MTYTRKFNEARYRPIAEVISKLERLRSGGRVVVGGLEREALARVRYLLYDWLSHMGLKESFKIKMDYARSELIVQHQGAPASLRVRVELGGVRDDLMRELIANEERAQDLVNEWLSEGKITKEEGTELMLALEQVLA